MPSLLESQTFLKKVTQMLGRHFDLAKRYEVLLSVYLVNKKQCLP